MKCLERFLLLIILNFLSNFLLISKKNHGAWPHHVSGLVPPIGLRQWQQLHTGNSVHEPPSSRYPLIPRAKITEQLYGTLKRTKYLLKLKLQQWKFWNQNFTHFQIFLIIINCHFVVIVETNINSGYSSPIFPNFIDNFFFVQIRLVILHQLKLAMFQESFNFPW